MKQKAQVRAFKNELRNYNYYVSAAKKTKEIINNYYYELSGVKACDPSRPPLHSLPDKERENRIREAISRQEKFLKLTQAKINQIDRVLSSIDNPLKSTIKDIFLKGETLTAQSCHYNLSNVGLYKKINKAIERALNG